MLNDTLTCAIIEDDPEDALLLARYIDRASNGRWASHSYSTYEEAAAALEDDRFDIAFVDLHLNDRSGLDLLRDFERRHGAVPVIMLSGGASIEAQEEAIDLGAYDFIPKDELTPRLLKRAVHHACNTRGIEEGLRRSADTARTANQAKSSFLACMSHDLRTPLNAIIGFSDALMHGATGPLNEEMTREYANYINQSGRDLLEIINTVLDLAKIEEQKFVLNREWIDLVDLVTQQTRILRPVAEQRDLKIVTNFSHDGRLLLADTRAVKQMLTNLLSNAIRFSHEGGEVQVVTSIADGGIELRVNDQGVGMTTAELKLAMMPFGQATREARIAREGTGLGLTIVQALMDEHEGVLMIDSRKGVGTASRLRFPSSAVSA